MAKTPEYSLDGSIHNLAQRVSSPSRRPDSHNNFLRGVEFLPLSYIQAVAINTVLALYRTACDDTWVILLSTDWAFRYLDRQTFAFHRLSSIVMRQFLPFKCYCVCFCTYHVFSSFLLCCNTSVFVICAIKNYLLTYLKAKPLQETSWFRPFTVRFRLRTINCQPFVFSSPPGWSNSAQNTAKPKSTFSGSFGWPFSGLTVDS